MTESWRPVIARERFLRPRRSEVGEHRLPRRCAARNDRILAARNDRILAARNDRVLASCHREGAVFATAAI
ncbi:MAG: hypothetical protein ACYCYC_07175 [Bellilinea sp.]